MHLLYSKSVRIGNKTTTKPVERLGSIEEIKARCCDQDPIEWAKEYPIIDNSPNHPRNPPLEVKLDAIHRCYELGENIKSPSY